MILTLNPFTVVPQPVDPVGPETSLANFASELYLSGDTEQALTVAQEALAIARTIPTLLNASIILEVLGRFDEAFTYAAEAFYLDMTDKRAVGHYGRSLLRKGDMGHGWPLYLQDCNLRPQLRDFIPEWTGQDLDGKRILIVEGEGYGDNIYFLRWLYPLRNWGARIDYICQPSLAPLVSEMGFHPLENWSGNVDFRFTDYDYHTSILTLPYKLGVTLDNYKWDGPYIKVPAPKHDGMRVGICALAGETFSQVWQRSMHASQLQHVLNSLPRHHQWVNLIYKHGLPVEVDAPILDTWLDTAHAIATCDLVITVDTGVAHLAGAMGVTTYTLLPGGSAWQYLLHRLDHPLYPSMRLFRNYGKGLDNAVEEVCDHLSRL